MKRKRWRVKTHLHEGGPVFIQWDGRRTYRARQCKKCKKVFEVPDGTPLNKTHEEYLALSRTLGKHIAAEMIFDPFARAAQLAIHFLTDVPRCPMCLEAAANAGGEGVAK